MTWRRGVIKAERTHWPSKAGRGTDEVVSEIIKLSDLCFCYFRHCIVLSWIIARLHKEELEAVQVQVGVDARDVILRCFFFSISRALRLKGGFPLRSVCFD